MRTPGGVAYFDTFEAARDFGATTRGYPAWRVVLRASRGWCVEVRPGGPLMGPDGHPHLEPAPQLQGNPT